MTDNGLLPEFRIPKIWDPFHVPRTTHKHKKDIQNLEYFFDKQDIKNDTMVHKDFLEYKDTLKFIDPFYVIVDNKYDRTWIYCPGIEVI